MAEGRKKYESSLINIALDSGVDLENRVLYLDYEIDDESIMEFTRGLRVLESKSDKPIFVHLNSCGGTIYDGLAIYGMLRRSPCEIIIEAFGSIMSMATIVLCAGDVRFIDRYAHVMIHELSTWVAGELTDIKIEAAHCAALEAQLASIYEERTAKKKSFWKRFKKARYFTPEKAIEVGLAHSLIQYPDFKG